MRKGDKLKAAMKMVATPSNVGGARHLSKENTTVLPSGLPSSSVILKSEAEERSINDIKIYNRVTDEIIEFDDGDEKSLWMPHPVTGIFVPQQDALHATLGEGEISVKNSKGEPGKK